MSQPLLIKFVCFFTGNHVPILIFHLDPPSPIFQKKVPVNSLILSHLTCRQFLVFHLKKQYFFNRNVYYRYGLIKCYGMMSTTDSQSHFAY